MTSLKKNKVVHWDKKYDSGQGAKRISNAGVPRALLGKYVNVQICQRTDRNHYACDGNFCKLTQNRNNLLLFILQECIKCINKMYLGEHSIILRKKHVAWGKVMITLKSLLFHFFSYHLCALKLLPIVRIILVFVKVLQALIYRNFQFVSWSYLYVFSLVLEQIFMKKCINVSDIIFQTFSKQQNLHHTSKAHYSKQKAFLV